MCPVLPNVEAVAQSEACPVRCFQILERSRTEDVSMLVVGDPFGDSEARTHE